MKAFDPDKDSLTVKWEILPDNWDKAGGGDKETKPIPITGLFLEDQGLTLTFQAPLKEGPYRLYAYVYDGKEHVAAVNTPFFVIE